MSNLSLLTIMLLFQLHKHNPWTSSRIINNNDVVTSCRTSASHHRYKITSSAYHSDYQNNLITQERNKLSHKFRTLNCIHTSDKYLAPDKVFTISHKHIFIRLIPSSQQGIWNPRKIHKQTADDAHFFILTLLIQTADKNHLWLSSSNKSSYSITAT